METCLRNGSCRLSDNESTSFFFFLFSVFFFSFFFSPLVCADRFLLRSQVRLSQRLPSLANMSGELVIIFQVVAAAMAASAASPLCVCPLFFLLLIFFFAHRKPWLDLRTRVGYDPALWTFFSAVLVLFWVQVRACRCKCGRGRAGVGAVCRRVGAGAGVWVWARARVCGRSMGMWVQCAGVGMPAQCAGVGMGAAASVGVGAQEARFVYRSR